MFLPIRLVVTKYYFFVISVKILIFMVLPSSLFICCNYTLNMAYSCEHGFVINLKHVKILDFIISGCILCTKIYRMVMSRLVFLNIMSVSG